MNKATGELIVSPASVAIFVPCLFTGGTEVATLETALALNSLGYQAEVIVYFDEVDGAMFNTFLAAGLVVHRLDMARGRGWLSQWRLAAGLVGLLRRGGYAAIWLQYMTPTLVPMMLARVFSPNVIAAVHVAASHYSPLGLARLRWLARHACARLVCVSNTVANGIFGPESRAERGGAWWCFRTRWICAQCKLSMRWTGGISPAGPRMWRCWVLPGG